ncbi:tripartite motif-containing protein 64C-like [Pteronotus mesoamericanus]|uniref:tripartite motif-containing protein 64C-like n=1 Tax=Pteronotus mesoamericanus TaxID=1884717 RepID=UPI0023EB1B89|nr:tripartite motif-containing protein 64C-like [Pteronotus parnellii mesoamericanus]
MDSDTSPAFQNDLTCSICMNYFLDPVTIDCGHSFCRPCLYFSWEEAQTPMHCPECRVVSERPDFKTNIALRNLASIAREARAHYINGSEEQICVAHKEAKGLFCEVEKNLLCGLCSESPEHAAHSHSPVQWSAEEYREELLKRMSSLRNMTQEMRNNLKQEASKTQSLEDYVALRRVMIKAEYRKMHLFLYEEEQFHLDIMEREAKEIFQQLKESEYRMTQQKESLKGMLKELTDMCHKPNVELLQDLGNVLERTGSVQMQKPQPVNPELTLWRLTGILDMLNNFRVDDVLSEETISCHISLSKNVGMVFGDDLDSMCGEPQRVQSFAVWGTHTFTSGRHYWEVDIPHYSPWILGVCKDSLINDTDIIVDFEGASLLFSLKVNDHYCLSTNCPPLIQYVKMPLGKIGVFVDHDNATVSFYDAEKGSLISSLVSPSFSSPLKPFLCFDSP